MAGGVLGGEWGAGATAATLEDYVICPLCQSDRGSFVVDSRDHGTVRRRRHQCYDCDKRYSTYEIPDVEYQRIQSMKVNANEIDSVITSLRAIKVHFGDRNGNSKT